MRIWRTFWFLGTAVALLSSPAPAQTLDELLNAFVEITDNSEYKSEKSVRVVGVTKWAIPIEFNIVGASSPELIGQVEMHMKRLAHLSHLEIDRRHGFVLDAKDERKSISDVHTLSDGFEFATMREDTLRPGHLVNAIVDKSAGDAKAWLGNFSIVFGKRLLLARVFDNLVFDAAVRSQFVDGHLACFSTITVPEGARDPRLAIVLIPTDQDAWLIRRCMVEETTQALGLVNDIPGSTLTLFDDTLARRRTQLTVYDEMFLRVLYSPEIKLGMTGQALRETARRLIESELSKKR